MNEQKKTETFEDVLRTMIKNSPIGSLRRNILKAVLGECRRKKHNVSEQERCEIINNLIKIREKLMRKLANDNEHWMYNKLREENEILKELLPPSLTKEEIKDELKNKLEILSEPDNKKALNIAIEHFKKTKKYVDYKLVCEVVGEMRKVNY